MTNEELKKKIVEILEEGYTPVEYDDGDWGQTYFPTNEDVADALIAAGIGEAKEAKKEAEYWKNEAKTARADIDDAVKEITERIFCELRDWFAEQYDCDYGYEIKAFDVVCDIVTIAEKYGVELGAKDDD